LNAVTLANVNARSADFSDAEIAMSDLSNGDFRSVDFSNATLNGARLTGGRFGGADFEEASMNRTDIRGADLSGAEGLSQSQISRACGDASTRLPARLTVRVCRGVSVVRTTPPAARTPPAPPRSRNTVVVSSDR
jgi:uncharacterized protein YjbI with pentapeptide repeats